MKGSSIAAMLLLLAMAYLMIEPGKAMTCADVDSCLVDCIGYLTGTQPEPGKACCNGVQRLKAMATTTVDRRFACGCVKQAALQFQNINDDAVAALPAKCSVPLTFPINLQYDCTRIP